MKDYQREIIESNEPKIVVNSCAAAGKTTCIIERIRFLVRNGVDKNKIVMITFTNAAAEEMKERLGTTGAGIFIGTVHSYINYLLLCKGVPTSNYLEKEQYDKLFELISENPYCIQPVEHLFLDEAQDSDELQWNFILNQVKPKNFFIVGDTRQAIYGWKGSSVATMKELMQSVDITTYNLPINYRNDREILNFAKRIIAKTGDEDESICNSARKGLKIEEPYDSKTLISCINQTIENGQKYNDWFILCRTNAQINDMIKTLNLARIPCDTFKRGDLDLKQFREKMKDNTVKVLTIHCAKGLEANNVAVQGAMFYNDEERRVSYVAATRAKHLLIWFNKPKKKKKKVTSWI